VSDEAGGNPPRRRRARWPFVAGGFAAAFLLLILVWDWNWFRPLAQAELSSTLGRPVTIGHLDLKLGRISTVVLDDLVVGNPAGFQDPAPLARIRRLTVSVSVMDYIRHRQIVVPGIIVTQPDVSAVAMADGHNNYTLAGSGAGASSSGGGGASPRIGNLEIDDGHVRVVDPKLRANFEATVQTQEGPVRPADEAAGTARPATGAAPRERQEGAVATAEAPHGTTEASGTASGRTVARATAVPTNGASETATPAGASATATTVAALPDTGSRIIVRAHGTYAGQPVTGTVIGGALLSLRDARQPWPIDIHLQNGTTHVAIIGSVQDPMAFAGARVRLELSGTNMALLTPLTGIPIPETPAYRVAGDLDYRQGAVRFDNMHGTVGHSDLEGDIAVADPTNVKPTVTANLRSTSVNLVDLGGFIGAPAGHAAQEHATASAKVADRKNLLPTDKLNIPKLNFANVHLRYVGEHIQGRSVPLDNLLVTLDIVDGTVEVHPLSFGVGSGTILANVRLVPAAAGLQGHADVDFRRVDLSRLMAATHAFQGAGAIGGRAVLDGSGDSVAAIMADGNGELKLFMGQGGNVSAMLVDLSGLEFGNALLSALGVPSKAQLECFVADLALEHGVAQTRALLVATDEANITGKGDVDFRNQTIDYALRTAARHFSIGSFPAPINVTGPLGDPSIMPGAELAVRGGLAAGLGFLFPPLALLPTIQLGIGQSDACEKAITEAQPERSPRQNPAHG
jgi:AsmA family protein